MMHASNAFSIGDAMAMLTVRNLSDDVHRALRLRAAQHGRSTEAEGLLPVGKRKNRLTQALDGLIELFGDRILPFDTDAARRYATLATAARKAGCGFPTPGGYIAAIAVSRGLIVASRDTAPYQAAGVAIIDPWRT
jgi:predicted nucleic acid-binding protein